MSPAAAGVTVLANEIERAGRADVTRYLAAAAGLEPVEPQPSMRSRAEVTTIQLRTRCGSMRAEPAARTGAKPDGPETASD
jgi:hypothetical protein